MFRFRYFCILIISLFTTTLSYSAPPVSAPPTEALSILQGLGLEVVNEEPTDFELPQMDGTTKKLSSYRGNWIWLVFWATWCGPCGYELPVLQKLYSDVKDEKMVFLGVSIDQGSQSMPSVKRFLSEKGISFPVFHDPNGTAARSYQASAVPSLYVISPDWRLVGLYRGAKNWDQEEVRSGLLKLSQIKSVAGEKIPKVALPTNLAPPEIDILPLEQKISVGESFPLKLKVKWKGRLEEYLLKVPKLTLPTEVELENIASESSENMLTYIFTLKVLKEGKYTLGPCELAYLSRVRPGGELYARSADLEIDLTPKKRSTSFYGWLILVVSGLLVAVVVFLWKKQQKSSPARTTSDWKSEFIELHQKIDAALEAALVLQHKSEKKNYHLSLIELLTKMESMITSYRQRFKGELGSDSELDLVVKRLESDWNFEQLKISSALTESILYGGHLLSASEVDSFRRMIERVLSIRKNLI